MQPETQRTDADARLVLPTSFANAVVIVEQASEAELRVRRADAVREGDLTFIEECVTSLGDVDRDYFVAVLEKTSIPSPALIQAAGRYKGRHG